MEMAVTQQRTGNNGADFRLITVDHVEELVVMLEVGGGRPVGTPGLDLAVVLLVVRDGDGVVNEVT